MLYTLEELSRLPTIRSAHFDDLKIEAGAVRVWLSRLTVADGARYENQVTVERLEAGNHGRSEWRTIDQYPALR
jgi:hypothetical protein